MTTGIRQLTEKEWNVLAILSSAWNEFLALPDLSESDKVEFMQHIHSAQQAVAARPIFEFINKK